MFLSSRSAGPEDFRAAFALFGERFFIPAAYRKDVLKMWVQILAEGNYYAPMVEDLDQPEGKQIVALGFAFAVSEALMDHARSSESPPHLWRWPLERWKKGQAVWLEKKEARKLEAEEGVSFFNYAAVDVFRYSGVDLAKLTDMFSTATTRESAQHRTRHVVTEPHGAAMRDRLKTYGMKLFRDYGEFLKDPEFRALPDAERPYLMGADFPRAATDMSLKDTAVGKAAVLGPPKFGFTEPEQEVMKMALRGLTDQVIAEKLGLTLVAIKKRWEGIYEKVNERTFQRAWEGSASDEAVTKVGRRQLLQMIAEHPEEFWPSAPKKRAAR
jgi:DNA-binding CsgD family transcriptional regulator